MTPRLRLPLLLTAFLAATTMIRPVPADAAALAPVGGNGNSIMRAVTSAPDLSRLAMIGPRGPTFSDRVSYPRYLGGYGIGPSARRTIETRTGARTRSYLRRWESRHDTGYTLR